MISDKNQNQESGDSSTNLQGQNITINQGITYSDAKQIATDVFQANALSLAHGAGEIARHRAEELATDFFEQLESRKADAVAEMANPGMQAALYEAQKQYAKSGDKDLEGLLVDILVERASTPDRNTKQIVLDDSLVVAAKLTAAQMDALTVIFLFTHVNRPSLNTLDRLQDYLVRTLSLFVPLLTKNSTCYAHLEYSGCVSSLGVGSLKSPSQLLLENYPGLFSKGFDKQRLIADVGDDSKIERLTTQCLHFVNLLQFNAMKTEVLKDRCDSVGVTDEEGRKAQVLFNGTLMNANEVKSYMCDVESNMAKLFDVWEKSNLSKCTLTSVGISIALANYHRRANEKLDLSVWIND